MKIKVEHISNTFNYGSLMMAVNTLSFINTCISGVEFFVDCSTEEDLDRLRKETKLKNIFPVKEFKTETKGIVGKIIEKIKRSQLEADFYVLKIVLGGDDISEYYMKAGWLLTFPIMLLDNIKLPTILLGQTIGPFTSYRKILARITLNRAIVYTRDDICLDYVKKLGIRSECKGRDLAFLELPNQVSTKEILDKYRISNNEYIVIVPSGLTTGYTNNYNDYLNEQINIVKGILANKKLKDKKVVLLPHVKDSRERTDLDVVRDIKSQLTVEADSRVVAIQDYMLASEAREILGNALFTITGRMHAAVSTLFMRKPAISLSYSVKYEGVIGSGLDLKQLVVEAAGDSLWKQGEITESVLNKIDYILDNYDELVHKIDRNVTKTSEIAIKQLANVVNDIKRIATIKKNK